MADRFEFWNDITVKFHDYQSRGYEVLEPSILPLSIDLDRPYRNVSTNSVYLNTKS